MALAEKLAWAFLAGAVLLLFISIATIDPQNTNVKVHDLAPVRQEVKVVSDRVAQVERDVYDATDYQNKVINAQSETIIHLREETAEIRADVESLKTSGVFARCHGVYEHNATHFGMNCEMVE